MNLSKMNLSKLNIGDVICQKHIGRCGTGKLYNQLFLTVCYINIKKGYPDNITMFSLGFGIIENKNKRILLKFPVYNYCDQDIKRYFKTKYLLIEKIYDRDK